MSTSSKSKPTASTTSRPKPIRFSDKSHPQHSHFAEQVSLGRNPRSQRQSIHREKVGTALATRIEGLLKLKSVKGCGCGKLAAQMDGWGVAGCELHRLVIVAALVKNRDVLVESLRETSWVAGLAASLIPETALQAGAEWLLDKAIEDVRNQPSPPPRLPRQRVPKPPRETPPARRTGTRYLASLKKEQDRLYTLTKEAPPPEPDPFISEPILHFGAHLWPVRGAWQWHVQLWNFMPDLINGKCFVGITTSSETDSFDEVVAALDPRFECVRLPNTSEGENPTFRWLQTAVPQGPDDVLIYCHGKGAKPATAASEAVRRWSEAMYQTIVFNHDLIREKLAAGYTNVHSFRTFGRRPLSPNFAWHPSGTFFAVRAKYLSGRAVKTRYGGVEAWLGDHFKANQSWCEFYDNSMFTTLYDHVQSQTVVRPMLIEWWRVQNYESKTMCSTWGKNFCRLLPEGSVKGAEVIEVGCIDVNGSCRPWVVQQLPKSYVGVDIVEAPGVDIVCTGEQLPERVGFGTKDLIICTEVLEHVEHWFEFMQSIWSVLRPGGILLLTTRSPGFPLHNYPEDHWRFTLSDMLQIFSNQDILTATKDPTTDPGVGVIVKKQAETLQRVEAAKAPS